MLEPVSYESLPDEKLVDLAKNDRRAMEALILRYTGFIWNRVYQLYDVADAEDLVQEGFLGLISAVCRYDPFRGVPFSAYAVKCVTNRILSAMRSYRNLPLPVGASDVPPFSRVEDPAVLPDAEVQSRSETARMICAMVNRLSKREYQVCILIYSGASYAEAAKKLHTTSKSVDNALQRARRKMRDASEGSSVM